MKDKLHNVQLNFYCPVKWDDMEVIDGASRFCTHCAKQVHDFSDAKQAEFMRILAEQGGVCGRFRAEQMIQPQTIKLHGWQKWVSAALLLVGINLFNGKATAQTKPTRVNQAVKEDLSKEIRIDEPVGSCGPKLYDDAPEFPGGYPAFKDFMASHLHYKDVMPQGRLFVTFMVDVDGTIGDIKVVRGLSPEADAEAVRVLKLMPKWKPAVLDGKKVKGPYTVPITLTATHVGIQ